MSESGALLIVDDDPTILALIEYELQQVGIAVRTTTSGEEALALLAEWRPSALVLDLGLPDMRGQDVLAQAHARFPSLPIIVVTGNESLHVAVECMKAGACDFLQKPFTSARLLALLRSAHERGQLRARLAEAKGTSGVPSIQGTSPAILKSIRMLKRALGSDLTVLLEGESGTGKELFARALHDESARKLGPFVAINCGSIPEDLIDSELFGHVAGAFTGAHQKRMGLVQRANGGTLFLDEIGELSLRLQVRLLRVLQERKVRPVGSNDPVPVDIRVIAATNRVLEKEVRKGAFREDLYYRLAEYPIHIPPLRERDGDALLLAEHFLSQHAAESTEGAGLTFSKEARDSIDCYTWPGNVRQLESMVRRAVLLAEGPEITMDEMPDELVVALHDSAPNDPEKAGEASLDSCGELGNIKTMAVEEQGILIRALNITHWNVEEAARRLGIGRATVYRRIQTYSLTRTKPVETKIK
ncbi:MAG: sigma-54-dependent Fis family transcriptional regulator [Planctomycetes bacterium]|nr:sigma-54-dependent Fis family transcriptional regulator [Planctomycetota bacterium]